MSEPPNAPFDPVLIILHLNDHKKGLALPAEALPDLEAQIKILRVMAGYPYEREPKRSYPPAGSPSSQEPSS